MRKLSGIEKRARLKRAVDLLRKIDSLEDAAFEAFGALDFDLNESRFKEFERMRETINRLRLEVMLDVDP